MIDQDGGHGAAVAMTAAVAAMATVPPVVGVSASPPWCWAPSPISERFGGRDCCHGLDMPRLQAMMCIRSGP